MSVEVDLSMDRGLADAEIIQILRTQVKLQVAAEVTELPGEASDLSPIQVSAARLLTSYAVSMQVPPEVGLTRF